MYVIHLWKGKIKKVEASNPGMLAMRGISKEFIQDQEDKTEKYCEMKGLSEVEF